MAFWKVRFKHICAGRKELYIVLSYIWAQGEIGSKLILENWIEYLNLWVQILMKIIMWILCNYRPYNDFLLFLLLHRWEYQGRCCSIWNFSGNDGRHWLNVNSLYWHSVKGRLLVWMIRFARGLSLAVNHTVAVVFRLWLKLRHSCATPKLVKRSCAGDFSRETLMPS